MADSDRGAAGGPQLLGKMLISGGFLDAEQMKRVLDRQRRFGGRLASHCLSLGLLSQQTLLSCLSQQLGYPAIDLSRSIVKLSLVAAVPYDVAVKVLALPVAVEGDRLLVALVEPQRRDTVDEIAFRTGRRVVPHLALEIVLRETIDRCYPLVTAGGQEFFLGEEADLTKVSADGFATIVTGGEFPAVSRELRAAASTVALDASAPAPRAPLPDGKKRILIVDDDPELLKLCERVLRPLKQEIILAATGFRALEAIRNTPPDVILLDAMLPEVHGFEICRQVKSSARFSSIPVIMMSAVYRGWRFREDILTVYRADAFVEKPFDINQLYRLVQDHLNRATRPAAEADAASPAAAQVAYEEAQALFEQRRLAEAEARIVEALSEQPFAAPLRHLLGRVRIEEKKPYEAMNELERAVELAPELFVALKDLAILYQERGFRRKASEMWERAKRVCGDRALVAEIEGHLKRLA